MNTFKKSLVTGMVLLSLSLTACGQNVPQHTPTPTNPATVSQSATPTDGVTLAPVAKSTVKAKDAPTMAPKDSEAKAKVDHDTPMGVNIDEIVTKYSSDNYRSWANDNALNPAEGVRKGLEAYQTVTRIAPLYKDRVTTNDYELVFGADSTASMFSEGYLTGVKSDIAKNGKFEWMFPTADKDGIFPVAKKADGTPAYVLDADENPVSVNWDGEGVPMPAMDNAGKLLPIVTNINVDVTSLGMTDAQKAEMKANPNTVIANPDAIVIYGTRNQVITNSKQQNVNYNYDFSITVIPQGNDWVVNNTSWDFRVNG